MASVLHWSVLCERCTHKTYLFFLTGAENAYKRNVSCDPSSTFCGAYDPTVDASNMNEFAHGAFRLFHANTPENVSFYDSCKSAYKI